MKRRNQRGSVMVEFSLAGIAMITLLITTVQMCIGMWQYHTLAYAVHEATRYASVHGRGCVTGTTSCAITVGNIASEIRTAGKGLVPSQLNVTLSTDSGATTACNPITVCLNNSTRWPPTTNLDNVSGKRVSISATYRFRHTMLLMWPGSMTGKASALNLPASSTKLISF
jgi:Flp pilus assembly protein TadG